MSEYTEAAEKFLPDAGTTLDITFQYTGPYFDGDKTKRDVYRFTLKNARGEYSSTFGDSTHNTERRAFARAIGKGGAYWSKEAARMGFSKAATYRPTAYDILACLEKYEPDTFDNWAAEMGYNERPLSEYPTVLKIWTACVEQYRGLSRMFSADEMEQLREIS